MAGRLRINGNQISWSVNLPAGASADILWRLKALQEGSYSIPVTITRVANGQTKLLQTLQLPLQVMPAQALIQDAQARIQALAPTAGPDQNAKTQALKAGLVRPREDSSTNPGGEI